MDAFNEQYISCFFKEMNCDCDTDRWELWKAHRESITRLILRAAEGHESESVIIFGAGNCDDIGLFDLTRIFKKIVLVDIDGESLERAILQVPEDERSKFEIIGGIEFTGLNDLNFFSNFADLLSSKASVKKIIKCIRSIADKIDNRKVKELIKGKFSLVISAPVYTQIFYPAALKILYENKDGYVDMDIKKIIYELAYVSEYIVIQQYNDLLCSLIEDNGKIFVWTDAYEFTKENKSLMLETQKALKNNKIHTVYEALAQSDKALVGGFKGLGDLTKRLKMNSFIINSFLWPFSNEKVYFTCAVTGELNKN